MSDPNSGLNRSSDGTKKTNPDHESVPNTPKGNNGLERRVKERTDELARANETLKREISERKHAQSALEHERHLLNALMANRPHTI